MIAVALGDIARDKGIIQITNAKETGLVGKVSTRLSAEGLPEFSTVLKVIEALGLQFHARSGKTRKAA